MLFKSSPFPLALVPKNSQFRFIMNEGSEVFHFFGFSCFSCSVSKYTASVQGLALRFTISMQLVSKELKYVTNGVWESKSIRVLNSAFHNHVSKQPLKKQSALLCLLNHLKCWLCFGYHESEKNFMTECGQSLSEIYWILSVLHHGTCTCFHLNYSQLKTPVTVVVISELIL